jgi:hypothetical protein
MLARLPLPLLGITLGALLDGAHAQGTPPDYAPKTNVQCPDTTKTPLIRVRSAPAHVSARAGAAHAATDRACCRCSRPRTSRSTRTSRRM